jgi:hypothetical protein
MKESCMKDTPQTFHRSPRIDTLLTQVTETPDLAKALLKALTKHIACKTKSLKQRVQAFESKWKMTFEEFSEWTRTGTITPRTHSGEVESDFRAWEQTEILLKHYKSLQIR